MIAQRKYYTADITWCSCGCKNTKCERHISNLNKNTGKGYYSVADFSEKCQDYRGEKGGNPDEKKAVR